jgi:hypothetical protein
VIYLASLVATWASLTEVRTATSLGPEAMCPARDGIVVNLDSFRTLVFICTSPPDRLIRR